MKKIIFRKTASILAGLLILSSFSCQTAKMDPQQESNITYTLQEPLPMEPMNSIDAWDAAEQMGYGINIGNTLENTTRWEVGWGNPTITQEYIQRLADLGFKSVRLPVAWHTYSPNDQIHEKKMERVGEVVNWITEAGMYCIVNIHWDNGWIDSDREVFFPDTYATFSEEAENRYIAIWNQIAHYFQGKNELLIFEALNEETNFSNEIDPYGTLTRVNQLFIDVVRNSGGNNDKRLLIVTGYYTDIAATCDPQYTLPKDSVKNRLMISVHYYTPWPFCGMNEDADWGKMKPTWGSVSDVDQLNQLFDRMDEFCRTNDIPAFIGEYGVVSEKESESRINWLYSVAEAALSRNMVPMLWDTGDNINRSSPYNPTEVLQTVLDKLNQ